MRKALVLTAISLAALSACNRKPAQAPHPPAVPGAPPTSGVQAPAPSAAAVAIPARTPGLWEQKVTSRGMTQATRICLDKAAEARFAWWGQNAGQGACSHTRVTPRSGGGWSFASSCDMGENGKTSTSGTVTGDFAKSYKLSAKSTVTGARTAAMNGTTEMTLEATWKGPCPAGMQPGDMIMPGGMKINMAQAHAR